MQGVYIREWESWGGGHLRIRLSVSIPLFTYHTHTLTECLTCARLSSMYNGRQDKTWSLKPHHLAQWDRQQPRKQSKLSVSVECSAEI